MNRESYECTVFESGGEARAHGVGGIWFDWIGDGRNFPADVAAVWIMMPVNAGDDREVVPARWTVAMKNPCGAQWQLSGARDKPTLSPSLHWVDVWHGYLRNGHCRSC